MAIKITVSCIGCEHSASRDRFFWGGGGAALSILQLSSSAPLHTHTLPFLIPTAQTTRRRRTHAIYSRPAPTSLSPPEHGTSPACLVRASARLRMPDQTAHAGSLDSSASAHRTEGHRSVSVRLPHAVLERQGLAPALLPSRTRYPDAGSPSFYPCRHVQGAGMLRCI